MWSELWPHASGMASVSYLARLSRKRFCGCSAFAAWQYALPKLRSGHIVGLTDGEGSFCICGGKPVFSIGMNLKELPLLEAVRSFLYGHGTIATNIHNNLSELKIRNKQGLLRVVQLFKDHPLWTTKWHDFKRWQRCVELYCSMQHLTEEGQAEIRSHSALMNGRKPPGLPTGLAVHGGLKNNAYDWISGFTSGEGCFSLQRDTFTLRFDIAQSRSSALVLHHMQTLLGMGRLHNRKDGMSVLSALPQADLLSVQSFFASHPLVGSKRADFQVWSDVLDVVVSARCSHGRHWRQFLTMPEPLLHAVSFSWNQAAAFPAGTGRWKDIGREGVIRSHGLDLSNTDLYRSCFSAPLQ